MEDHTFEVFYKGFATYCRGQGWPTPDRTAIRMWEAWKRELVARLVAVGSPPASGTGPVTPGLKVMVPVAEATFVPSSPSARAPRKYS